MSDADQAELDWYRKVFVLRFAKGHGEFVSWAEREEK